MLRTCHSKRLGGSCPRAISKTETFIYLLSYYISMENDNLYEEKNPQEIQQTPSIKITKNSKGYNFEFRIISLDEAELERVHNMIVKKISGWEMALA